MLQSQRTPGMLLLGANASDVAEYRETSFPRCPMYLKITNLNKR